MPSARWDISVQEKQKTTAVLEALLEVPLTYDLACVGVSVDGLSNINVTALRYLLSADRVYCYPATPKHLEFMKLLCPQVVDLTQSLYAQGTQYKLAYQSIIAEVLNSVRAGYRVVYAQQGSPAYLALTARIIFRVATNEGYNTVMCPGISSFECVLAKIVECYDVTDFQVFNCRSLADGRVTIDPQFPCFLVNLMHYLNPTTRATNQFIDDSDSLGVLALQLSAIYPSAHQFSAYSVCPYGGVDESAFQICELREKLMLCSQTVTIFVPPIFS